MYGQTSEKNLWLFWSSQVKLSPKFALTSDVQVRSADKSQFVNTILLRPGIQFSISESQSATIGYVYFGTWDEENGKRLFDGEHRVYEEYLLNLKAAKVELTNRLRLEQRFFQNKSKDFAQRFRYYFRAAIPLVNTRVFDKGLFLAFQDEIFLNVQNKQNVNNNFFVQNRTYAGIGYRLSKKMELELGYMYRYQVEEDNNLNNHILQLTLTTEF
jgi:hypothetical protein